MLLASLHTWAHGISAGLAPLSLAHSEWAALNAVCYPYSWQVLHQQSPVLMDGLWRALDAPRLQRLVASHTSVRAVHVPDQLANVVLE